MKSAHHLYKTRRIVCITSIRTENNLPLNNIIILLENHEILLSLAMIFSIFSHTDTCDEYYDVGFGFGFLQHICRTIPASTAAAVADATRQQQRKIIENKEEEEKDHCRCWDERDYCKDGRCNYMQRRLTNGSARPTEWCLGCEGITELKMRLQPYLFPQVRWQQLV